MILERGCKSWAERTSINLRTDLGLRPFEAIPPAQLASYLEVRLCTPLDIPGIPQNVLDQLLKHDPSGWSGVSIQRFGRALVIYNPEHSSGRQSNDIMHELEHLILDHKPTTVILSQDGSLVMRSFNQQQEEEADWLAGCLLLPRDALVHSAKHGLTIQQIADKYFVSAKLATFRQRITGIDAQKALISLTLHGQAMTRLVADKCDVHFCGLGFFHGSPDSRATNWFETSSAALSRSYLQDAANNGPMSPINCAFRNLAARFRSNCARVTLWPSWCMYSPNAFTIRSGSIFAFSSAVARSNRSRPFLRWYSAHNFIPSNSSSSDVTIFAEPPEPSRIHREKYCLVTEHRKMFARIDLHFQPEAQGRSVLGKGAVVDRDPSFTLIALRFSEPRVEPLV
jgi:IrrE N-terminal-like domain